MFFEPTPRTVSSSIQSSLRLNRRFAFFPGNLTNEFRYEVAGEFFSYLRDEFAGAFITDFEMGDPFCVVELVQVGPSPRTTEEEVRP